MSTRKAAQDLSYLEEELGKLAEDLSVHVSDSENANLKSALAALESARSRVARVTKARAEEAAAPGGE